MRTARRNDAKLIPYVKGIMIMDITIIEPIMMKVLFLQMLPELDADTILPNSNQSLFH